MADFLPVTIESVLAQDYPRIEYIVMDGASTDATLDVLKRYEGRLRYTSAPDRGPADAIDRGFAAANGEIVAWLNADDTYEAGAVRTAVEYMLAHPDVDIACGEGEWMDESGARIGPYYPTGPVTERALQEDCLICQPASFMRREAYRKCPLDPELTLCFDYDLWIRMAAQGLRFGSFSGHVANTRMHSNCKTLRDRDPMFRTSMDLVKRHYGYVPFSWILSYTAFRIDGRDQFFEPFRPSLLKYLASLPLGLRYNSSKPFRYLGEWTAAGWTGVLRRLRGSRSTSLSNAHPF